MKLSTKSVRLLREFVSSTTSLAGFMVNDKSLPADERRAANELRNVGRVLLKLLNA